MITKSNITGSGDRRAVNPGWFTGKTWMKVLSEKIGSKDQDIYHVHFEGGSRTKLHKHDGNQVLVCTKGRGSLVTYEKTGGGRDRFGIRKTQTVRLAPGDIVHIPAGTLHTHGSTGNGAEFAHIAINVLQRKGAAYKTVWYESDYRTEVSGTV